MNTDMDLQTLIKIWVNNCLEEMPRGAKTRLAEHLGITPTQLYKMLNTEAGKEQRVIRADEYVKITAFLGKAPDHLVPFISVDETKIQLLSIYDNASPETQSAILAVARALASMHNTQ